MQSDYLITIFSRRKGKSRSFGLNRPPLYYLLLALVLLAFGSAFLGPAFFCERGKRKLLQVKVAQLERRLSQLQEEEQQSSIARAGPQPPALPAARSSTVSVGSRPAVAAESAKGPARVSSHAESPPRKVSASIESPRARPLPDSPGFKLEFKLVNLAPEPISGHVAVIAALKSPHQPRFVSFPQMQLSHGMPVKLRRSVGFYIRRFKMVSSRFHFPFSYAASFRVLIYNPAEELLLDSSFPAAEIDSAALVSRDAYSASGPSS